MYRPRTLYLERYLASCRRPTVAQPEGRVLGPFKILDRTLSASSIRSSAAWTIIHHEASFVIHLRPRRLRCPFFSMVLLAMTPAVAEVVQLYLDHAPHAQSLTDEPSLDAAAEGNPISHRQLIEISRYLNADAGNLNLARHDGRSRPSRLSELLRGCSVYIHPRQPKPKQVAASFPDL
jgi:hypothetical protein